MNRRIFLALPFVAPIATVIAKADTAPNPGLPCPAPYYFPWQKDLLLYGNCFLLLNSDGTHSRLDPERMWVMSQFGGEVLYRYSLPGGGLAIYLSGEIMHVFRNRNGRLVMRPEQ